MFSRHASHVFIFCDCLLMMPAMRTLLTSLFLAFCMLSDANLIVGQAHAGVAISTAISVPPLKDLERDSKQAGREGKPLILFFSLPDCTYCKVVRQNYLLPLLRNRDVKQRPLIREVDITSMQDVKNFNRTLTTQREVAQRFNVQVAPTVLFMDSNGNLLTTAIIGGDIAGLYGGYLDNAFAESAEKLSVRRFNNKMEQTP